VRKALAGLAGALVAGVVALIVRKRR
jgi:hypothetical protein